MKSRSKSLIHKCRKRDLDFSQFSLPRMMLVALLVGIQGCFDAQPSTLAQSALVQQSSSGQDRVKWLLNLSTHWYVGDPDWFPALAVGNGGVIYASGRGSLYAINADGSRKWTADTSVAASSIACGKDGTIYTRSPFGNLSAFHPDGSNKWRLGTRDLVGYGPLAVANDGTVYTSNLATFWRVQCTFCAVNSDGSLKWGFEPPGAGVSSIAVGGDGTVYVGMFGGGGLFALDPSGALKWKYFTSGAIIDSIAIGRDGTIYALYMSRESPTGVSAINHDGSTKWRFEATDIYDANGYLAVASDGTVYMTEDTKNRVLAIKPDGSQKWVFTTRDHSTMGALYRISTPFIAVGTGGTVYAADHGSLFAIKPDGSREWSFSTGNDSPITIALGNDGSIYANSWDSNVYALKP